MRHAARLSRPSRSLTARSLTTTNSQFCALLPVGALSASSIRRMTSSSSTGSGLRRRIERWVSIASSSGIVSVGGPVRGWSTCATDEIKARERALDDVVDGVPAGEPRELDLARVPEADVPRALGELLHHGRGEDLAT